MRPCGQPVMKGDADHDERFGVIWKSSRLANYACSGQRLRRSNSRRAQLATAPVSTDLSPGPPLPLMQGVRVRHEVVRVAVVTATSSVLTEILWDITRCSATGIPPKRASSGKPSPRGCWRGAKPAGQKYPSADQFSTAGLNAQAGSGIARGSCDG